MQKPLYAGVTHDCLQCGSTSPLKGAGMVKIY